MFIESYSCFYSLSGLTLSYQQIDIIEKGTGKYKGTMRSEMRLDDNTAQLIIDLLTNHSKFKNNTLVNIKETINPMLAPIEIR